MSIYQCLSRDDRYTPSLTRVTHEAETQREAITWLEENGGGIYRNILHNFECGVSPKPIPNPNCASRQQDMSPNAGDNPPQPRR